MKLFQFHNFYIKKKYIFIWELFFIANYLKQKNMLKL